MAYIDVLKHLGWRAAEGTARFAFWLESPRVFPWATIGAGLLVVVLMIGAFMQRGGVC
jgi:hypothetical protein